MLKPSLKNNKVISELYYIVREQVLANFITDERLFRRNLTVINIPLVSAEDFIAVNFKVDHFYNKETNSGKYRDRFEDDTWTLNIEYETSVHKISIHGDIRKKANYIKFDCDRAYFSSNYNTKEENVGHQYFHINNGGVNFNVKNYGDGATIEINQSHFGIADTTMKFNIHSEALKELSEMLMDVYKNNKFDDESWSVAHWESKEERAKRPYADGSSGEDEVCEEKEELKEAKLQSEDVRFPKEYDEFMIGDEWYKYEDDNDTFEISDSFESGFGEGLNDEYGSIGISSPYGLSGKGGFSGL